MKSIINYLIIVLIALAMAGLWITNPVNFDPDCLSQNMADKCL